MSAKKRVKTCLSLAGAAQQANALYVRAACPMKVGIDYSYKSPSWTVFNGFEYFSYFIAQRRREEGLSYTLQSSTIPDLRVHTSSAMNMMPKGVTPVDRNHRLATIMLETIDRHRVARGLSPSQVHCALERCAYGFGKLGMISMSDLQECAGVLKNYLFRAQYTHVDEISPASIKKVWTSKGNARKPAMLRQYMHRYGFPDPSAALGFSCGVDFSDADLRKIPKPIEDLVDSMAIVCVIDPLLSAIGLDCEMPPPSLVAIEIAN
jgi:hypothetical protein